MCETVSGKPSVLFVCVHNAGRSQMAAAFLTHQSAGRVEVRSAGSAPAETVNPAVSEATAEAGIDLSAEVPEVLTIEAVQASDLVITMGWGDACPVFPGKRYRDWKLDGSGWSGRRGGLLDPGRDRGARPHSARRSPSRAVTPRRYVSCRSRWSGRHGEQQRGGPQLACR